MKYIILFVASIGLFTSVSSQPVLNYNLKTLEITGNEHRNIFSAVRSLLLNAEIKSLVSNQTGCTVMLIPILEIHSKRMIEGMDNRIYVKGKLKWQVRFAEDGLTIDVPTSISFVSKALADEIPRQVASDLKRKILKGSLEAILESFEVQILDKECNTYFPVDTKNVSPAMAICFYELMIDQGYCVEGATNWRASMLSNSNDYYCQEILHKAKIEGSGDIIMVRMAIRRLLSIPHDVTCKDEIIEVANDLKSRFGPSLEEAERERISQYLIQIGD